MGAGPSGLAALRALDAAGIDAVAFEGGARVGGIWTLEDRPTAAYPSLHLITSRERTEFAEFPMPDGHARLPEPRAVGRYLEAYVEHFGLARADPPGDRGGRARRAATAAAGSSSWTAASASASTRSSSPAGTTRCRSWPEPGLPGRLRAASSCTRSSTRAPSRSAASASLVVGMGNSAMDIATELSHVAERTLLSVRRGSWIVPKRLLGHARRPGRQAVVGGARAVADPPAASPRCCCASRSARPSGSGCPRPSAGCSRTTRRSPTPCRAGSAHGAIDAESARSSRSRATACGSPTARGAGRRDRVVHRLPRRDPVPRRSR